MDGHKETLHVALQSALDLAAEAFVVADPYETDLGLNDRYSELQTLARSGYETVVMELGWWGIAIVVLLWTYQTH